jgi:uncharacterized membrane protein YeaQ/YmgE (transglycosylase-associated protein family)
LPRLIVTRQGSGGWVVSIVVGIVGSMVGAFLGRVVGLYRDGETAGFVMSIVGAVVVVSAYHALSGRRGSVV